MPLCLSLLLILACLSVLLNPLHCFPMKSVISSASASPTSVADSNMMMTTNDQSSKEKNAQTSKPRSCIFRVGECAGRLCGISNTHLSTTKPFTETNNTVLVLGMSELLQALMETATSLDLNLIFAIQNKLALNKRKYPVELCKGKAGKYTQYSNQTGVTKDNQSTESECPQSAVSVTEFLEALPGLAEEILQFATERNWTQYHTARNLVLALLGEVGELAELFQWKGDDKDATNDLSSEELDKMSQELADVSIYLLRLATVCEVVPQLGAGLEELYL